jgi:hypothetical protein
MIDGFVAQVGAIPLRTFLPVNVTRPTPGGSRPVSGRRLSVTLKPRQPPKTRPDRPKRDLTAPRAGPGSPAGPSDPTVPVAKPR